MCDTQKHSHHARRSPLRRYLPLRINDAAEGLSGTKQFRESAESVLRGYDEAIPLRMNGK